MRASRLAEPFTVTSGKDFRLKDVDPQDTAGISKEEASAAFDRVLERIREAQEKLYAQGTWAVLLIFQAMDAAGKDSTIKHVMSSVNPQGCEVTSFKQPSATELAHDFLWRTTCRLPERGRIGVFNRSYYEEVLIVRVHPELLAKQRLPPGRLSRQLWQERFDAINHFEAHLDRSGVLVRKFFLHVSKAEQKRRFLARLDDPAKHWKFGMGDVAERAHWPDYMRAYQEMIQRTASRAAPWLVVPADHKWFTRLVVAAAIADALEGLRLAFPKYSRTQLKQLEVARAALNRERG